MKSVISSKNVSDYIIIAYVKYGAKYPRRGRRYYKWKRVFK